MWLLIHSSAAPALQPPSCAFAQCFTAESLEFQERISQRNGLSEQTYLPPGLHLEPPVINMKNAREEACMVLFGAVSEVLERTGADSNTEDSHDGTKIRAGSADLLVFGVKAADAPASWHAATAAFGVDCSAWFCT